MSSERQPPTHRPATAVTIIGTLAAISTLLAVRRHTQRRLPATVVATMLWVDFEALLAKRRAW